VVACGENALEENPEGGLIITKPWKCESCEVYNCAKACSINAIQIDPISKKPVICTQCGICADFCSHKVISCIEVKEK
jgi:heterodisulfide reductase subunit A-like polyferredoxin